MEVHHLLTSFKVPVLKNVCLFFGIRAYLVVIVVLDLIFDVLGRFIFTGDMSHYLKTVCIGRKESDEKSAGGPE